MAIPAVNHQHQPIEWDALPEGSRIGRAADLNIPMRDVANGVLKEIANASIEASVQVSSL